MAGSGRGLATRGQRVVGRTGIEHEGGDSRSATRKRHAACSMAPRGPCACMRRDDRRSARESPPSCGERREEGRRPLAVSRRSRYAPPRRRGRGTAWA
jgi:hypothetical protein